MLFILAGVLGFITIAGLGFVLAGGGDGGSAKAVKRAQLIAGGDRQTGAARAKALANTPDARRKQILKTLKEQDQQKKKASLTIAARLRAAGLGDKLLLTRRARHRLALAQQDLAGGGLRRELLRARLARRRRTQSVLRRHGQRSGGHRQELVGRDLGEADALTDARAGAQRQQRGGQGQDGDGA